MKKSFIQCAGRTFVAEKAKSIHSCDGCAANHIIGICLELPTCSFDSDPSQNVIFVEVVPECKE